MFSRAIELIIRLVFILANIHDVLTRKTAIYPNIPSCILLSYFM